MKKIAIIAVTLFALACLGVVLFVKDIDVNISEEMAQKAINEKVLGNPINSRGVELTIQTAIIDFRADNTAEIDVAFEAGGFGYSGKMSGQFATGLRYEAPTIYLADLNPVKMQVLLDEKSQGKVNDVKNVATDFLKRQRNQMLSDEAKESLDNIVGRNEDKLKELAVTYTYKFFETLPIYNLNDAGIAGSVASLALKDVRFTDDHAIVTLSPSQLIFKILSFIAACLIGLSFIAFYAFGLSGLSTSKDS